MAAALFPFVPKNDNRCYINSTIKSLLLNSKGTSYLLEIAAYCTLFSSVVVVALWEIRLERKTVLSLD
jgi:hypothetical protein